MKVRISKRAKSDINDIKTYIVKEWGWGVYRDFHRKLDATIEQIKSGIIIHQYYENTEYRKVLITEHNTLIYYISENILYIVTILNNYKDPDTNYKIVENA